MTASQNQIPPVPRPSTWRQIRTALTHPAGMVYVLLWLLAAATLALRGYTGLLLQIAVTVGLLTLITTLLLRWLAPNPPEVDAPRHGRTALWGQVAFILAFVLLTGLSALSFHNVAPAGWERIPLWTPLEQALELAGGRLFGNDNWVRNPVLYMVLPGAVLLLCRVRPAELGLRKGYRSWAVAAPFLLVVGALAAVKAALGDTGVLYLLPLAVLDNFLQNGFMEEFLFRGALQTRLAPLIGEGWSLVISSLLFGVWHLGATTAMLGGDYLAGLAMSIASQGTIGLVFGMIAMRTRSLIAPTVAHITINLLG
ncbi:MAG: CPBP family intramembrane glutamic endopeptidase [Symbiobacterium sp.]|uniref:lysostaphin resistance A-like protein n=1 Tax=Symbiobacterium sp. TaxID=1971213 RepID=UPI00346470E7